jgi:hypothetical protein
MSNNHLCQWMTLITAVEQKNCANALEVDMEGRLPVDPKVPSTDDAEYVMNTQALKENRMAMSLLNTALVGDALGIFIKKKRYQPDGINLTLDFNKELNAISMTREADPNVMIDQLEALSARYTTLGLDVPDDTFVARAFCSRSY